MAKGWTSHKGYEPRHFGSVVRRTRQALGLTLDELGTEVAHFDEKPLHRSTVLHIERGDRRISPDRRRAIVEALRHSAQARGLWIDVPALWSSGDLGQTPVQHAKLGAELLTNARTANSTRPSANVPGVTSFTNQQWLALLASAQAYARGYAFDIAKGIYLAAQAIANSAAKQAVATAHLAETWFQQDAYGEADALAHDTLATLSALDLMPDTLPAIETISNRHAGSDHDQALHAYAVVAQLFGLMWHTQGQFERSERALRAALAINRQLQDFELIADNLRYLGRSAFEQGVQVNEDELAWRSVIDPSRLDVALSFLAEAISVRQTIPGRSSDLGEDWRLIARIHEARVSRDEFNDDSVVKQAVDYARDQAEALVGNEISRTAMHLRHDQGRWEISRAHFDEAENSLRAAQEKAIATSSPSTLSAILSSLGMIFAERDLNIQRAKEYVGAALLLWPFDFETRDSLRTLTQFVKYLHAEETDFELCWQGESELRDLLSHQLGSRVEQRMEEAQYRMRTVNYD